MKIDVVAGQGVGAGGAALAAIGGGARLWEEGGIWRSARVRLLYSWTPAVRVLPITGVAFALLLLVTVVAAVFGWVVPAWWAGTLAAVLAALVISPRALAQGPAVPTAPTRADILRGEYGRYRANNDLLSYHLDVRVDPATSSVFVRLTAPLELPLTLPGAPERATVSAEGEASSAVTP